MSSNSNEMDLEELAMEEEQKASLRLAQDIKWLMNNEQFKRAILNGYINDTALNVGVSFTGSDMQVDQLKGVSHLTEYLTINAQ